MFPDARILHIAYFDDLMITAGVCIFIMTGLATKSASKLLTARPVVYTGRISYSIYLFHGILLLTFTNLLYGLVPLWAVLILTLVSTFVVSALSFKYLEVPSISIGRKLAARL